MGLTETQARIGARYLGIADGRIVARSKQQLEGYEPYTKKDGTTGYEQKFASLSGYLLGVARVESDFGPKWEFIIQDEGVRYVLSMGYSSGYAKHIINALCNPEADLAEKIELRPYSFIAKDTGKQKQGVTVLQNATKVPWKYGIDTLPPMEQVTVKGQKVWDDSKQLDFLQAAIETDIRPRILPF